MSTPQDGVAALVKHLQSTGTKGAKLDAFRNAPLGEAKTADDGARAALEHAKAAIGKINPATVAKAEKYVAGLALALSEPSEQPKGGKK